MYKKDISEWFLPSKFSIMETHFAYETPIPETLFAYGTPIP